MAIFKIRKQERFAMIPNALLQDERLSFKAKGLLCYLLHLPENWEVNVPHLISVGLDGRDAIYSMLKELINVGYVVRENARDATGKSQGVVYNVYESSTQARSTESSDFASHQPLPDNPEADYPDTGYPDREKPDQLISTKSNKKKIDKKTAATIEKQGRENELKNAAASLYEMEDGDYRIDEDLTDTQMKVLAAYAKKIAFKMSLSEQEVFRKLTQLMLSKSSFTHASQDFMKKLNTVIKSIQAGTLNLRIETPIVQPSSKAIARDQEIRKIDRQIESIKSALKSPVAEHAMLKASFETELSKLYEKQKELLKNIKGVGDINV